MGLKLGHVFMTTLAIRRLNGGRNGAQNGIYREEVFRYLLESESKRSERSGHLCRILLVYRTDAEGAIVAMEPKVVTMVLAALSRNLRDTDYIGWYREGRVVGGVLTLLGRESLADGCSRVRTSLVDILQSELGLEESRPVQIRLYQHDEVKEVEFL
jgi:hypothetical protein